MRLSAGDQLNGERRDGQLLRQRENAYALRIGKTPGHAGGQGGDQIAVGDHRRQGDDVRKGHGNAPLTANFRQTPVDQPSGRAVVCRCVQPMRQAEVARQIPAAIRQLWV